mgnify:CR=1 FL=1
MIYPPFLKKGDIIGVTGCSAGKTEAADLARLNHAALQLEKLGYCCLETENVRTCEKGRSSDAKERAKQLLSLTDNPKVRAVVQVSGGDYLGEMLPYTDFDKIQCNPKWYQGYSDPTGLLYSITVNCDMATVYGSNFCDFGMKKWHPSLFENIEILEGKRQTQNSFPLYKDGFAPRVTGYEDYEEDTPTCWEGTEQKTVIAGRLLGGCLDVLLDLVGTPYDKTVSWCEKYKEDGILWYLESFALSSERLTMGLWHLREAGWFRHASGFVFGRPAFYSSDYDITYREAVLASLGEMNVPIIFEADIGHKAPRFTVVNGAKAVFTEENHKGCMKLEFR